MAISRRPTGARRLIAGALAGAIGLGGGLWVVLRDREKGNMKGDISRCRIVLVNGGHIELHDRAMIQMAIIDPVRKARDDIRPSRYIALGHIELDFKDGRKENIALFLPWGHFALGERYFIGDLTQ